MLFARIVDTTGNKLNRVANSSRLNIGATIVRGGKPRCQERHVAIARLRSTKGSAIIVKRAPQLELLQRASVCITHAGLNTVLESLAQGVPQVAIPVSFDQPGVAARIADKQTGVVTSLDKLTADRLSTLLNEVLSNSIYRDNARKLQKTIADANGLSVAADLVEESLGTTKRFGKSIRTAIAATETI